MRVLLIALLAAISYAQTGETAGAEAEVTPPDCESFTLELECTSNGCGWDGEECDILAEVQPAKLTQAKPEQGKETQAKPEQGKKQYNHPVFGSLPGSAGEGGEAPEGGEGGEAAPVDCEAFILQAECEAKGCGWDGEECDLLSEMPPGYKPSTVVTNQDTSSTNSQNPNTVEGEQEAGNIFGTFDNLQPQDPFADSQPSQFLDPFADSAGATFNTFENGFNTGFNPSGAAPFNPNNGMNYHPVFQGGEGYLPEEHPFAEAAEAHAETHAEIAGEAAEAMGEGAAEAGEGGEAAPFDCEEPTLESVCVAHDCCWDAQAGECDDPGEVPGCTAGGMGAEGGEGGEGAGAGEGGVAPAVPAVPETVADCRLGFTPNACANVDGCVWFQADCYQVAGGQLSTSLCNPNQMCTQALTCLSGHQFPTGCGPSNCDRAIGTCEGGEVEIPFLRKSMPLPKTSHSITEETLWFFLGASSVLVLGAVVRGVQYLRNRKEPQNEDLYLRVI